MIKTTALITAASGVAFVSAAIPRTAALTSHVSLNEPGVMLLLATAFFGLAAVVRRHGKSADRP